MTPTRIIKTTLLLSLVFCLVSVAISHPGAYDYGFDTSQVIKRQIATDQSPYVITGLPTKGTLPFRKEVRDLQQDEDQRALYILGLSPMQYEIQTGELSFYQIAGMEYPVSE